MNRRGFLPGPTDFIVKLSSHITTAVMFASNVRNEVYDKRWWYMVFRNSFCVFKNENDNDERPNMRTIKYRVSFSNVISHTHKHTHTHTNTHTQTCTHTHTHTHACTHPHTHTHTHTHTHKHRHTHTHTLTHTHTHTHTYTHMNTHTYTWTHEHTHTHTQIHTHTHTHTHTYTQTHTHIHTHKHTHTFTHKHTHTHTDSRNFSMTDRQQICLIIFEIHLILNSHPKFSYSYPIQDSPLDSIYVLILILRKLFGFEDVTLIMIFTGRNKVVAKVIFLHLSVIHSVHRGGGGIPQGTEADPPAPDTPLPWTRHTTNPPDQAHPPQTRHSPPDQTPPRPGTLPLDQAPPRLDTAPPLRTRHTHPRTRHPSPDQTHPPGPHTPSGKQTPAYGLRAAGTHPTGMHSYY